MYLSIVVLMLKVLQENRELYKEIRNNKVIVEKKLISSKEFAQIFGISIKTQKHLRIRIKHPLPYLQIVENGSIRYNIKTVEKWLENYEKNI